jgi:hypothetical protein
LSCCGVEELCTQLRAHQHTAKPYNLHEAVNLTYNGTTHPNAVPCAAEAAKWC